MGQDWSHHEETEETQETTENIETSAGSLSPLSSLLDSSPQPVPHKTRSNRGRKYLRNTWDLLIKHRYELFQYFSKKIWCNLSVFWYWYWQTVSNINTMVWPPWADVISPVSPHWSVNSLICRGVSITQQTQHLSLLTVSHGGDITHCRCDSASS